MVHTPRNTVAAGSATAAAGSAAATVDLEVDLSRLRGQTTPAARRPAPVAPRTEVDTGPVARLERQDAAPDSCKGVTGAWRSVWHLLALTRPAAASTGQPLCRTAGAPLTPGARRASADAMHARQREVCALAEATFNNLAPPRFHAGQASRQRAFDRIPSQKCGTEAALSAHVQCARAVGRAPTLTVRCRSPASCGPTPRHHRCRRPGAAAAACCCTARSRCRSTACRCLWTSTSFYGGGGTKRQSRSRCRRRTDAPTRAAGVAGRATLSSVCGAGSNVHDTNLCVQLARAVLLDAARLVQRELCLLMRGMATRKRAGCGSGALSDTARVR